MEQRWSKTRKRQPGHKPLVVNVLVVGPFEEEEEGIGVASDIVKAMGEDPDTLSYLGETGVGDLRSWMRLPWLADDEAPGPYITIPQYRFQVNKTKQNKNEIATQYPFRDLPRKI